MGLHKEGILDETQVSTFRIHLLDTLIASPADHENEPILRDKLVFLQELLYAKCISEEEYHSSKRPLLQRLAVQGAEIEARDITIMANPKQLKKQEQEEEWSVIDLKDEKQSSCLLSKDKSQNHSRSRSRSAIKGAASVFGFGSGSSSHKPSKKRAEKSVFDFQNAEQNSSVANLFSSKENPFWEAKSILMQETISKESRGAANNTVVDGDKVKRKTTPNPKKQWGFDGLKKWKRSDEETAPLPLNERSDNIQTAINNLQNANNGQNQANSGRTVAGLHHKEQIGENNSRRWTTFEDEENYHPNTNLFASSTHTVSAGSKKDQNPLYENPFGNV